MSDGTHTTNGAERYKSKRKAGISPERSDGSMTSEQTDVEAAAAEKYAAEMMDASFNDGIFIGGDGGHDFKIAAPNGSEFTVEVVWLGFVKGTNSPRSFGHLIVNPYEQHRWADIYVVVAGCVKTGFSILGWTTHSVLVSKRKKDFGFGLKFALPTNLLVDISFITHSRAGQVPEVPIFQDTKRTT